MLRRLLILLVAYPFLALVGMGYVLFFTPLPFEYGVKYFGKDRVELSDLSGSLFRGLRIGKIAWKFPRQDLEVVQYGIDFKFDDLSELFGQGRLVVRNLSVERAQVKIGRKAFAGIHYGIDPLTGPNLQLGPGAPVSPSPVANIEYFDVSTPYGPIVNDLIATGIQRVFVGPQPLLKVVGIQNFHITQYAAEYPSRGEVGMEHISFESLQVKDAYFQNTSGVFSVGEIALSDAKREFSLKGLTIGANEPKFEAIQGKIKVAADPNHVLQDIDFNLKIDGSLKNLASVKLMISAMGGKARLAVGPQFALFASFFDLTVGDFYQAPFPIKHLNLELNSPNLMLALAGMVSAKGDFKLGETLFRFAPEGLAANAVVGGVQYTLFVDPRRLNPLSNQGVGRMPLQFESNVTRSAQDNLARLLHQDRYAQLDEVRKIQIDTDLFYFDRAVPPAPVAIQKVTPVAKAVKGAPSSRKVERYPANERAKPRRR